MRERYVLKNIIIRVLSTVFLAVLSFVSRRFFLNSLGDEIMGLNAVLLSILSMLSLLELGIGNAIYFSLYKPLAEHDEAQVNAIMRMYAKIYRMIGFIILWIGLLLLPFLHLFIKTVLPDRVLYSAYMIMLMNTSLSYFMAYRRNIFNADQKEYFNIGVNALIEVAVTCTQMLFVALTRNFYMFLIIKAIGTIVGNIYIYYQSGRRYPYLKEKTPYRLSGEFKKTFIENVKALCLIRVSDYLVFGTDNILLSRYTDLTAVFIYSNYTTILGAVNQIFHKTFYSMQASVGNFMVVEGKEKTYELFHKIFFVNFLVTSYTSVALLTLSEGAITLWVGEKYVWPMGVTAVLIFNNYSRYISQAAATFKNAAGIYCPTPKFKYFPLLEGGVNIVASLFFILVCRLGILGVFLGTSVSTVVSTIVSPYALYRYYFKCSPKNYVLKYFQYAGWTILYCLLSVCVFRLLQGEFILWNLFAGLIVSFIIPIGLSSLVYHKTEEFQFVKNTVLRYLRKMQSR